jgi:hypothetical protein
MDWLIFLTARAALEFSRQSEIAGMAEQSMGLSEA